MYTLERKPQAHHGGTLDMSKFHTNLNRRIFKRFRLAEPAGRRVQKDGTAIGGQHGRNKASGEGGDCPEWVNNLTVRTEKWGWPID